MIWRRMTGLIALSLGMAMVAIAPIGAMRSAESDNGVGITIDARAVLHTLSPAFFGINYTAFWDDRQGSSASARALAQTPIKVVRFGGGVPADWYDWQDPYYKGWSTTSPLDLWRYAHGFGGMALFQTNVQGHLPNPPGRSYAVNSPQNAAAWVRYNDAHHISAIMEVGNEEDMTMHQLDDPAFQSYVDRFGAQARAMHTADRATVVLGPAGTNEYYWWALDSLGMFLRKDGNRLGSGQADGISLHFYKGATWDDAKDVARYWLQSDGPWAFIQRTIRTYDSRSLPVYITEWNVGSSSVNNSFNATLAHALVTADMIGAFAVSGVSGEEYFTIHTAHGWGILYGSGEGRPADSPTPAYYAMVLWGKMGSHVLRVANNSANATEVSAYATSRSDGSLQVLVINKSAWPQLLHITLSHVLLHKRLMRVYELRGRTGRLTDRDALYNGVVMPSPLTALPGPRIVGSMAGARLTYTVGPYTAAVLDLR